MISLAEVVNVLLQPLFKKLSKMVCCQHRSSRFSFNRIRLFRGIDKVKSYVSFFFRKSSIHSFNFIADASNCFESTFWFLTFSFSMTGCVFMVLQLYRTMDFKAVTLVIDDQLMVVSKIPFPAVTISSSFPHMYKLWYPELRSIDEFDVASMYYGTVTLPNMSQFETDEHPTSKYSKLKCLFSKFLIFHSQNCSHLIHKSNAFS